MAGVSVSIYTYAGPTSPLGVLDPLARCQVTREHNRAGMLDFDYPHDGGNVSHLSRELLYLKVARDGVLGNDVYVLDEDQDDDANLAEHIKATCPGIQVLLDLGIVYPGGATAGMTGAAVGGRDPRATYNDATPGHILLSLVSRAQARGASVLDDLTFGFSATTTSAGTPWAKTYDQTYEAGTTIRRVAENMTDLGWCDIRFNGWRMDAYNPDEAMVDRPSVVLRPAREVRRGPRHRKRLEARSTMLVHGDERAMYEYVNPTSVTALRRREGFYARGGVTHLSTISEIARVAQQAVSKTADGFTIAYTPDATPWQPGVDFQVGDRIRYDRRRLANGTLEPLRVRTTVEAWDGSGERAFEVELNDIRRETMERLQDRLDGISQGFAPPAHLPGPVGITPGDVGAVIPDTDLGPIVDWWNGPTGPGGNPGGWGGPGGGGGTLNIFIQPNDPGASAPAKSLWYDTDAPAPGT